MASLSAKNNYVSIQFKDGVNNDIDQKLVDALNDLIRTNFPWQYVLKSITVSSLFDSHEKSPNSRHNQRKAIDISKVNGKSVASYNTDTEVYNLVQYIQREFEKTPGRRENFGPFMKYKKGMPYVVSGHHDHIHLSVD